MRDHNADETPQQRAGFYGLDLYSLGWSIEVALPYLDMVGRGMAKVARQRYGCLTQ